jgi:lysophospholipase L1-like esterase
MMRYILLSFLCGNTVWIQAQSTAVLTTYKFDFGTEHAAKGYIPITPESIYNEYTGYGFHEGAVLESVNRTNARKLVGDFITSKEPFFFSVCLPDGNYDVKVILGDVKGTSATTIRTECRRLMIDNVRTEKKQIVTKTFTVHKRDSFIRGSHAGMLNKIRLKPRELSYKHWDHVLTIEFNDSLPKVCAVEITPNMEATTVFLAGNSTVVDQDHEPWAAWGQMLPAFFAPGVISVANYAESGETLLAFRAERRLDKIWSMSKPGDYLFIEFTHNDQKPGDNFLDPFTSYKATLKEWITEAHMRQVIPVLVTSMHRRSFDSLGVLVNTLGDYPEAMRQVAAEEGIALIDLNAMSKALYEAWGPEESQKAFVHYAANTFPGQSTELKDNTHFSTYGAYELARCVVRGIADAGLPIGQYLLPEKLSFLPSHPDPVARWYWPLSPVVTTSRPDGN